MASVLLEEILNIVPFALSLKDVKETNVPLVLYRKGGNEMLRVNNEERTGIMTDIHSVVIQNGDATAADHRSQFYQYRKYPKHL